MQVVNSTVQAVKIAPHGLSGDLVIPEARRRNRRIRTWQRKVAATVHEISM